MSHSKQGRWTGRKGRRFSPRKPHRKGSKKGSSVVSPVQDPGPGASVSSHIALNYPRLSNGGSTSSLAIIRSLSNQFKAPGS
jgi:hypothetical protein